MILFVVAGTHPDRTRSLADLYVATTRLAAFLAIVESDSMAEHSYYARRRDAIADDLPTSSMLIVDEALAGPNADLWRWAMIFELHSLDQNRTWSLVPMSSDKKPISCKWVFPCKLNPDGSIACYKAHLVARGF